MKNYFALLLTCVVYIIGWNIDIMDVDATQYATIAREMLNRNDFLQVFDRGEAYLDKPPLVFWCMANSHSV